MAKASDVYRGRMHNLCCDNCHSHVAMALNLMRYDGSQGWNMVWLALYMVVKGRFDLRFRDRVVELREGEFCVVPRGVEHSPSAEEEAHVVLFEPASTRNTGNVDHDYTIEPEDLHQL